MEANVLLGASAATRLAAAFSQIGNIRTSIVQADGTIRSDDEIVAPHNCRADIAWFSPDLFDEGASDLFLEVAVQCPHLGFVQSGTSGFDDPRLLSLGRTGAALAGNKAMAPCIAEYVLYNLLDFFQNASRRRQAQAESRWDRVYFKELGLATCVLLGYGTIAREVALRLKPFGTRMIGVARSAPPDELVAEIVTPQHMGKVLANADIVISSLPLTRDTQDSLDAAFFDALRPGCLFVNVGRGRLVVEDDLRAALDAGQVAHAVLDVARQEPAPADSWLGHHPGITLTAHCSCMGDGLIARSDATFLRNLANWREGRPLENRFSG